MITETQVKSAIRRAPVEGKKIILTDAGERGAGRLSITIRAMPNRVLAEWYASYYRDGKRKSAKIGNFPLISLADARKRFREEFAPAISTGLSPKGAMSRRSRHNKKNGGTVRDLFQGYVDHLRDNGQRSVKQAEYVLLTGKKHNAADGIGPSMAASEVEPHHIVGHLAEIHSNGTVVMAAIARAYISAAFGWGMKSEHSYTGEYIGTRWGIKSNPVAAIAMDENALRTRDRFLTPKQFRAFWLWLVDHGDKSAVTNALLLNLALGQRSEEILRISEDVYDRNMKMLFWSTTKNGRAHSIPVPDLAADILDGMVPARNGLYFPIRRADLNCPARSTSMLHVIQTYIRETGAEPFVARDLRRTWKTLAGRAGVTKQMRDILQNHTQKSDVSMRHYDRYDYLVEKREAMGVWANYLDRIIAGEIDNDVVELNADRTAQGA